LNNDVFNDWFGVRYKIDDKVVIDDCYRIYADFKSTIYLDSNACIDYGDVHVARLVKLDKLVSDFRSLLSKGDYINIVGSLITNMQKCNVQDLAKPVSNYLFGIFRRYMTLDEYIEHIRNVIAESNQKLLSINENIKVVNNLNVNDVVYNKYESILSDLNKCIMVGYFVLDVHKDRFNETTRKTFESKLHQLTHTLDVQTVLKSNVIVALTSQISISDMISSAFDMISVLKSTLDTQLEYITANNVSLQINLKEFHEKHDSLFTKPLGLPKLENKLLNTPKKWEPLHE
jgi:hypothetical protein